MNRITFCSNDPICAEHSRGKEGYAFYQNWVGRIENRYYGFDSYLPVTLNHQPRTSIGAVRLGLAYLFGAPAPVVAKY